MIIIVRTAEIESAPGVETMDRVSDDVSIMIERIALATGKTPWKVVLDIIENGTEQLADQHDLEWS
jgi:hypothetical protein